MDARDTISRWLRRLAGEKVSRRVEGAPTQDLPGILAKHARHLAMTAEDWDDALGKYTAHTVHALNSLEFLEPLVDSQVPRDANLVLALVEKRLLLEEPAILKQPHAEPTCPKDKFWKINYIPNLPSAQADPPQKPPSTYFNLKPSLQTLRADIGKSASDFGPPDAPPNLSASVVVVDLYAGDARLGGRTLLALREFLRDVAILYPNLRGVILVGAFPDAHLIRKWGLEKIPKTDVLTYRTDLPLADLNGRWENLWYADDDCFFLDDIIGSLTIFNTVTRPRPTNQEVGELDGFYPPSFNRDAGQYQSTGSVFRTPLAEAAELYEERDDGQGGKTLVRVNNADVIIKDGRYVWSATGRPTGPLFNQFRMGLNETGIYNVETPIALPDILVSRIDARGIARTLVQTGVFTRLWMPDPYLERFLLIEYFQRNHNYRLNEIQHRNCAGVAYGSTEGVGWQPVDLRAAFAESQARFGEIDAEPAVIFTGYPECNQASFRQWLDEPAIMRSMLLDGNIGELALNGYTWKYKDFRDYWLGRGEKNQEKQASFYWNVSCWGNAPLYGGEKPYNACGYGFGTVSESLLFFADGLAVISRGQKGDDWPGKVVASLQPSPPGGAFEITLRAKRTFGETLRAIFEVDRNNPTLRWGANEGVRKCAYRWGITGDWTLRLNEKKP